MNKSDFLRSVRDRTGLETEGQAETAVNAVFQALREILSPAAAENVASHLPADIRAMWEPGIVQEVIRIMSGVDHLPRNEFLAKVQNTGHLADVHHAEHVCSMVFSLLREQLPEGAANAVAAQLSQDLRDLWFGEREFGEPRPGLYESAEVGGPARVEVFRSDDQIKREVEEFLRMNDAVDASDITVDVSRGAVTLRGTVKSLQEWEEAVNAAREALGVTEVRNQLRVAEAA